MDKSNPDVQWYLADDNRQNFNRNIRIKRRSVVVELNDLPVELLHRILIEAALASVRHTDSDDDVIEAVLTSLADVCGRWREIVGAWYFRRQFWRELIRLGRCQATNVIYLRCTFFRCDVLNTINIYRWRK